MQTLSKFAASLLLFPACLKADWPQFLGPQRNGTADNGDKTALEMPADGPKKLWQFPCGKGFAGPVVQGDKVYLFHRKGDEAVLDCLLAKDGSPVWQFSYVTNYRDGFGFDPGPRSTPTLSKDTAFLHGAEGMLHAVNLETGKLRWKLDLEKDYSSPSGFFGRCGAPLLVGDKLIVHVGGEKAGQPVSVLALAVADGKVLWQGGAQEAGYASPQLLPGPKPQIISFLRDGLLVLDAATGKTNFQQEFRSKNNASVNASTPVVLRPGKFFASACYEVGAGVWEQVDGSWKNVWQAEEKLDCHYGTPVLHNGHLYGMHGRQESGMELRCVAAADGKVVWKSPAMAAAEVILADGKLLCLTDKGELILVKLTTDGYQEITRAQLLRAGHRSPPALSGGNFYARDGVNLLAFSLKK